MLSCFFGGSPSRWSSVISTCACGPMPKMPWGWGKSTSKETRKGCKDISIDGAESPRVQSVPVSRRGGGGGGNNKVETEETTTASSGRHPRFSLDVTQQNSDPRSVFAIGTLCSRSPSPSTPSTRCPSFNDKKPPPQPLPLPTPLGRTQSDSGLPISHSGHHTRSSLHSNCMPPLPPSTEAVDSRILAFDASEIDVGTSGAASCTNSSVSSLGSVEVSDTWSHGAMNLSRLRPGHDFDATEQAQRSHQIPILGSTTPKHSRKNSKHESSRPSSPLLSSQAPSSSPRKKGFAEAKRALSPIRLEPPGHRFHHLNGSAPDSSLSSPARSPRRVSNSEHAVYGANWGVVRHDGVSGSAHGSSPGSGHNSGHYSTAADQVQLAWNITTNNTSSRRSPEPSPIPSPRQRSPAPSGTVSPLHSRMAVLGGYGGANTPDSPTSWHEDGKTSAHPLPLPPRIPTGGSPLLSPPISPTLGRHITRTDSSMGIPGGMANLGNMGNLGSPGAFPTRWQKGKLLGSGTFGNVYVGFNSDSGALCAMKEVLLVSDDSKSKESVKQLGQEIALLSRLRHQNIVQYIGTEALEDRLCIYLEYVSGGSIHKLLQEYGFFKEPVIRSFTRQILSGLAYLHNMNTVHRDVKGANILVDTNGKVKLADFGMAKHITGQSFALSFKGSPYWMAPEVIKHTNGYDLAVDIWSLGCTVLEMATAKPPWYQYEGVAAMFKIGNSKELPVIPDTLSVEGKDFVRQCLQRDPSKRPTAQMLLKHRFVEYLPDDRFDGSDVLTTTTAGIHNMACGPSRHDSDTNFPPPLSRTRAQLSPTASDLSRNTTSSGYGPSNPNSLSPSGQSRRHVYNGLSSLPHSPRVQSGASTPHNTGGYGSPHGSGHHALNNMYPTSGNYGGPISGPFPDGYAMVPRPNGIYGNPPLMNGGYTEQQQQQQQQQPVRSEFHWGGTPLRTPEGSPLRRDLVPQDRDILGMALGRVSSSQDNNNANAAAEDRGGSGGRGGGKQRRQQQQQQQQQFVKTTSSNGNLGEHVSQQLLRGGPKQSSPVLYRHHRPVSPTLSQTSSELSH